MEVQYCSIRGRGVPDLGRARSSASLLGPRNSFAGVPHEIIVVPVFGCIAAGRSG